MILTQRGGKGGYCSLCRCSPGQPVLNSTNRAVLELSSRSWDCVFYCTIQHWKSLLLQRIPNSIMPLPCRNNNHTILMHFPPCIHCRTQKPFTECKRTRSKDTISAAMHCSPSPRVGNCDCKAHFLMPFTNKKKKLLKVKTSNKSQKAAWHCMITQHFIIPLQLFDVYASV